MRALFCLFLLSVVVWDVEIVLAQGADINLTAEERAWLKAHPKIVLGLDAAWETAARVDRDGVLKGSNVDFVQLINEKTGANIQLKRGDWFDIVEQAKAHEIDGLSTSSAISNHLPLFSWMLVPVFLFINFTKSTL